MDAGGPFMNGMNAGIPIVLFQGVVIAVPGTAEALKALTDGKKPVF